MMSDDLFSDTGAESISRAAVMLVTEHDEIHLQVLGSLQNDAGDIMLRRVDQFAVGLDPCCR
jgi:hypothetical protein